MITDEDCIECPKFPLLHDFKTNYFIHVDALKSVYFGGILLVPQNFMKDFRNRPVSEFILICSN